MDFSEPDYTTCIGCKKATECGGCVAGAWNRPEEECKWKQVNKNVIKKISSIARKD